jgi:hypothetical protein
MTSRRIFATLAVVLSLTLCASAYAQVFGGDKKKREDTNTRTVKGVVTDSTDNPVNGAVVQMKDTKTLQVRSFITQNSGQYHFAGLSTNVDYELKADFQGGSSGTKTLSTFDNRHEAVINLKVDKK